MDNLIQIPAQRYPYLGNQPELSSLGLTIHSCGYTVQELDIREKPSWVHDNYCLVYFFRGSGVFELPDGSWQSLAPGTVFVTCPGKHHRYGCLACEEFHELWINFDGPLAEHLEQSGSFSNETRFDEIGIIPQLINLCSELITLSAAFIDGKTNINPKRIPGIMLQILNEIDQHSSYRFENINAIESIAGHIRQNPHYEWDFEALASKHEMSYSLLRKQFKQRYACPPQRFVNKERMRLATQHLLNGFSVKQCCRMVGLTDPYHFSRLFKQHIGVSPRAYVQSIRLHG